ncbi:MAG: DUF2065 family protein [Hyphomicrobiaceae bacterium]
MSDLLVAFGLVLVLEGLLWAAAPDLGRRMMEQMGRTADSTLRIAGAAAVAVGVFVVWLVRG